MRVHAEVAGVGAYLPERVLTNADLERLVDTSDEWIVTRTGIRQRRIAAEDQATSDLVAIAVDRALRCAGLEPSDVDLLIVATSTPDHPMPSSACLAQQKLGMTCPAFDLNAACSGFVYALEAGAAAIESGRHTTVVVAGADTLSRVVDFTDRRTCVLFGDAAGAVVLRSSAAPGVLAIVLGADGSGKDLLCIPAGGSAAPCSAQVVERREQYLRMNGPEVFKFAVRVIPEATRCALERAGLAVTDLRWLIPHQANSRILATIEQRLGIDDDRVFSNLEMTGNTSAASIPLALDDLYTGGRLAPGDLIGLVGFGAGLTWGAAILRWTLPAANEEA